MTRRRQKRNRKARSLGYIPGLLLGLYALGLVMVQIPAQASSSGEVVTPIVIHSPAILAAAPARATPRSISTPRAVLDGSLTPTPAASPTVTATRTATGTVSATPTRTSTAPATGTPAPSAAPTGTATPSATNTRATGAIRGGPGSLADALNASLNSYTLSCSTAPYSTQLGGIGVAAVQTDSGVSPAIPLDFDFWYMGTRYSQVFASSDGWLSFGAPVSPSDSLPANGLNGNGGAARPLLAPLWDNLSGIGGTASYATTGAVGSRVFAFEWWSWRWPATAAGAVITFRVRLYEGTGKVDFWYLQNATAVSGGSASIGLTGSNGDVYRSAQSITACPTFAAPEVTTLAARPASGTVWAFTPPTPNAPTGLTFTGVASSTVTLNWTDSSNNETGFVVYLSTDGTNFVLHGQTSANAGSYVATGLNANALYYWRVRAVSEGALSAGLAGSVRTAVLPTPTPTPSPTAAPTARPTPNPLDPHGSYDLATDKCTACHRSHTSAGNALRQAAPEESNCFSCHRAGGIGTNVQSAFTSYANTATRFLTHNVGTANGIHRNGESSGPAFGGANRHAECDDCHDPHRVSRGLAAAPAVQAEMTGTAGVNPAYITGIAPVGYSWLPEAANEYQVCFKCHSSFTTLPTYQPDGWRLDSSTGAGSYTANGLPKLTSADPQQVKDSRDKAQQFSPANASFHPVMAAGKNTGIDPNSFVSGWSAGSIMRCTDCHSNATPSNGQTGPHGSPLLHLLSGASVTQTAYNYWTVMPTGNVKNPPMSGEICFKCHKQNVYSGGNSPGGGTTHFGDHRLHVGGGVDYSTPCYTCHGSHGSETGRLINFNTTYVTPYAGYNSQTAWVVSGGRGTCYIACKAPGGNSVSHGTGKQYTP